MKRKRLALLLAAALTITSADGTALMVRGADFSSEPVQEEMEVQSDESAAEVSGESSGDNLEEVFESESVDGTEQGAEDLEIGTEETDNASVDKGEMEPEELLQQDMEGDAENGNVAEEEFDAGEESDFSSGEDSAAEASASKSIIPGNVKKIALNKSYSVKITKKTKDVWFAYTAAADGDYAFSSDGNGEYGYVGYCYDNSKVPNMIGTYFVKTNKNFWIRVHMKKGKTYYLCASMKNLDETGIFKIKVEKLITPSSVQVNTSGIAKKEFMEGIEDCLMTGLKLTLKYEKGNADQILTFNDSTEKQVLKDSYGNTFTYKFLRLEDGEETYSYLEAGKYELIIWSSAIEHPIHTGYIIKVNDLKKLPTLHIGKNNQIESPTNRRKWYRFTPDKSATYRFSPVANIEIRHEDKDPDNDSYVWEYGDSDKIGEYSIFLEKDVVYYIGFYGARKTKDNKKITKWNTSIETKANVSSLKLSQKSMVFTAGLDIVNYFTPAGKLTINHDDGRKAETHEVIIGTRCLDNDRHGMWPKIIDSSGKEISLEAWEKLSPGTYKLSYVWQLGNTSLVVESNAITITIQKKVNFDSYPKLKVGKNTVATTHEEYISDYEGGFIRNWYAFKVDKKDLYDIEDSGLISMHWKKIDVNGKAKDYKPKWKGKGFEFEAGNYLAYWGGYGKTTNITVNIKRIHTWDKGKITKKATCKENGVKTFTCQTCGGKKTQSIPKTTTHKFGKWTKVSDATVFAKQKQKRTCSVCGKAETREYGNKLKATIKLNVKSITLQQGQTTKAVKVTMVKGDSVKSWISSNKNIVTVDKDGTIKAQKKNGTAKITVTLKSGVKATLTVKVQAKVQSKSSQK